MIDTTIAALDARHGSQASPEAAAGACCTRCRCQAAAYRRLGRDLPSLPPVEERLNITSNEGAIAAAVANLGIVSTVLWGCRAGLERGTLVPPGRWDELKWMRSLLRGVWPSPPARAFADFLSAALS